MFDKKAYARAYYQANKAYFQAYYLANKYSKYGVKLPEEVEKEQCRKRSAERHAAAKNKNKKPVPVYDFNKAKERQACRIK